MFNHTNVTLVVDRQCAFMHAADNYRLLANQGAEPQVRGAHELITRISAAAHRRGAFRRRLSAVSPTSTAAAF